MTPEEEAADKAQKLRRLETAAANAMYSGATPDEVEAAVRAGVNEVLASPIYKAQQERAATLR